MATYLSPIKNRAPTFLFTILLFMAHLSSADTTLFKEDLSKGTINASASPLWSWRLIDDPKLGMMFGEGDIYSHSQDRFVSHREALRMNFNGRNNFCNVCGGDTATVSKIEAGKTCLEIPGGPHETYVYNQTNNFSRWKVISTEGDTVCVNTTSVTPGGDAVGGVKNSFSVGDTIFFPKVCGVNGTIGRDINRRSDCDRAINYLDNVTADNFKYGQTLARRFYLYIPDETVLPNITLKLGYLNLEKTEALLTISTQRNMSLGLVLPGGKNIVYNKTDPDAFRVPRNKWIYFEEVFKRETSAGANDGEYTIYYGVEGDNLTEPKLHYTGLTYGNLKSISIGGNWQHYNEVQGFVYFDNIVIANSYVGPLNRPKMDVEN